MAQIWPDRTLETASAVGTGPLALLGAVDGYRRFNETAEIGDTVFGARFGVDATGNPTGPYETGEFTYSADDVLALTTISASSNGGNPVDWSGTQWIMACPIGENFADWEAGVGAALTAADIGVSVQAYSTNLAEYAAVNPTAAGLALLDDADAPAQRTTLGLGTLATQSGTFSGTSSGTNTGDQTITLTGDVTGSGTGSFAATIANGAVSLTKQANMATASLVYRKTAGSGAPEVNTLATLKTDLGLTGTNSGDQTSVSGNAGTATALATPRTISITGKATAAGGTFDGTGNLALNVTAMTLVAGDLPSTAVTPGSYTLASITVDAQGRLTAASSGSGGTATLADGDYGDITASSSGTVLTIDAGVVTLAKIANATANSKLVGSGAAGSGAAYSEITLGSGLTMTGTTLSSSGGLSANSTTDILAGTDTSKAATADSIAALWEQGSDVASSGTISLGEGG